MPILLVGKERSHGSTLKRRPLGLELVLALPTPRVHAKLDPPSDQFLLIEQGKRLTPGVVVAVSVVKKWQTLSLEAVGWCWHQDQNIHRCKPHCSPQPSPFPQLCDIRMAFLVTTQCIEWSIYHGTCTCPRVRVNFRLCHRNIFRVPGTTPKFVCSTIAKHGRYVVRFLVCHSHAPTR